MDSVQIKCPQCSVILKVINSQNDTEKLIKCPNCGKKILVRFHSQTSAEDGATQYGGIPTAGATQLGESRVQQQTCLLVLDGIEYELSIGPNTIGRKASTSNADIQLETDDRYMSRNHALINVRRLPDGNIKVDISNSQNKNATKVNGQTIGDDDAFVLHDGDKVTMGKTTITFRTK